MRQLIRQHLINCTISRGEVTKAVLADSDLLFHWELLSRQLSNEGSKSLLEEFVEEWRTIRAHAFTKQLKEEYKLDSQKFISKSKALRRELNK